MDVEDNYISILNSNLNQKNISLAKITCSYIQVPKKDHILSCESGSLFADLNSLKIALKE